MPATVHDYEERTRNLEAEASSITEDAFQVVREVLLAPAAPKPAIIEEKVVLTPTKTEVPMPTIQPEQERPLAVLTLPEPVMPARMTPYVEELLAPPRFAPTVVEHEPVELNETPIAPTRELPSVMETAEDVGAELDAILNGEFAARQEPPLPLPLEAAPAVTHHSPERAPTPLETFTYFAEGLTAWHEEASPAEAETESRVQIIEEIEGLPEADKKAMVAISHEVADRLNDLEPTQVDEVAPVIAEITATAQKIQELSHSDLAEDLVMLEEVKEHLEELCQELFEALGIEYDETSINYFAQVVLLKQFKDSMNVAMDKDRMGTHEFKYRFPAFGAIAQTIAGEVLHFMLGRLALVQADPSERTIAASV